MKVVLDSNVLLVALEEKVVIGLFGKLLQMVNIK